MDFSHKESVTCKVFHVMTSSLGSREIIHCPITTDYVVFFRKKNKKNRRLTGTFINPNYDSHVVAYEIEDQMH